MQLLLRLQGLVVWSGLCRQIPIRLDVQCVSICASQSSHSDSTPMWSSDILFSTMIPIMKERKLRSLSQVKPRLMPRMFELWTEKGVSKRAQINYFNVMRWYWRVFGIQLDPIVTYAKEKDEFTINRNATHDKSWAGNDVDFLEIYEKMYAMDPVAERLLVAMKTFGLGLKESLRLQPHEVDGGNSLLLTKGTKTGRRGNWNSRCSMKTTFGAYSTS